MKDSTIEYQIIWHCPDGEMRPSTGLFDTKERAFDFALRGVNEHISPSSAYHIHEVTDGKKMELDLVGNQKRMRAAHV